MDPVAQNDANAEPWYQSGVGVFGAGGAMVALGAVIGQIGAHGADLGAWNWEATGTAISTLAAFAGVLYRRFMPGLKPMFHRWLG